MSGPTTTVFVVDDDEAIRSGVDMLLRSYGYRVESFASGGAFLDRCGEALPERFMAILDLSMPEMTGLELQAELKNRRLNIPIVFLSGEGDIPAAVNAVQQGAMDFVEKPVDTDLLLDCIETALKQQQTADRNNTEVRQIESRLETLTQREREVLEDLAGGNISKAIAHNLGISERTVELHRSRILKKTGTRNTTELLNRVIPVLWRDDNGDK